MTGWSVLPDSTGLVSEPVLKQSVKDPSCGSTVPQGQSRAVQCVSRGKILSPVPRAENKRLFFVTGMPPPQFWPASGAVLEARSEAGEASKNTKQFVAVWCSSVTSHPYLPQSWRNPHSPFQKETGGSSFKPCIWYGRAGRKIVEALLVRLNR